MAGSLLRTFLCPYSHRSDNADLEKKLSCDFSLHSSLFTPGMTSGMNYKTKWFRSFVLTVEETEAPFAMGLEQVPCNLELLRPFCYHEEEVSLRMEPTENRESMTEIDPDAAFDPHPPTHCLPLPTPIW